MRRVEEGVLHGDICLRHWMLMPSHLNLAVCCPTNYTGDLWLIQQEFILWRLAQVVREQWP